MANLSVLLFIVLAPLFLSAKPVLANGGTIQVASEPAGPYEVTVFTSPSPIRVGLVDVSVLVQRAGSDDLVHDARVLVTAEPIGHAGPAGTFDATREQATNKLFYAAKFKLPVAGRWRLGVRVSGPLGHGAVRFEVEATRATLLDRPLVVVLLVALPVVLILWWLSRPRGKGATRIERVGRRSRGPG